MNTVEKVAKILDARGWVKGQFEDDQGRCCVAGALYVVGHGKFLDGSYMHILAVANELYPAPEDHYMRHWGSLSEFNDRPERTLAEVRHVLAVAADTWEDEE